MINTISKNVGRLKKYYLYLQNSTLYDTVYSKDGQG